jgi:hypothetical protein
VVAHALGVLRDKNLTDDVRARIINLLEHEDATVVGHVLQVLEGRDLPASVISRVVGSLERRDPSIVGGAHSVLRGRNLAEHVLQRIGGLLGHGSPSVVVSALELMQSRDLPPEVLARVVGLLSHEESVVVWTALAVLAGRDVPDALLTRGVSRLLEAGEVDGAVLVRFLRGRLLPDQAALALSAWLAEAPAARWQVAVELDWPATFATELAANVRAMAAASAIDEVAAFDGLVGGHPGAQCRHRSWLGDRGRGGAGQAPGPCRARQHGGGTPAVARGTAGDPRHCWPATRPGAPMTRYPYLSLQGRG